MKFMFNGNVNEPAKNDLDVFQEEALRCMRSDLPYEACGKCTLDHFLPLDVSVLQNGWIEGETDEETENISNDEPWKACYPRNRQNHCDRNA